MNKTSPRIAILGAGAIGGFFGLMLSRAGYDVHYLFRGDYEAVQANGLSLNSKEFGDYRLWPINAYRDANAMPSCDWVFVGAKAINNAALAPAVNQVAAPGAKVVLLQNGLDVEAAIQPHLREDLHLIGGICFASVHRQAPGVIDHFGYGRVNMGYHSGPAQADADETRRILEAGAELFQNAGLESSAVDDLPGTRWQKLVMNMAFSGLTVLLQSGTRAIMSHSHTRALVRELMEEVAVAAAACGHPLPEGYIDRAMALNDTQSDFKASMLLDYEHQRPLELDAIYHAPLEAAARAGVAMPKVEMLYQTLCFLDQRNRSQQ